MKKLTENMKEYQKLWREKNKEKIKKYNEENSEKMKKVRRDWHNNNPERTKENRKKYTENYPEKLKDSWGKYREKNKEKMRLKQKEYSKKNRIKLNEYAVNRRKNNPILKISHNIRGRIRDFLKYQNITKKNKTFEIIGCNPEELKNYLESQFKEGMSWENYGYYGWHIDHIIPLNSAKTENEIYKLCHFSNLQPLWWNENLSKSNKITLEYEREQ